MRVSVSFDIIHTIWVSLHHNGASPSRKILLTHITAHLRETSQRSALTSSSTLVHVAKAHLGNGAKLVNFGRNLAIFILVNLIHIKRKALSREL